MNWDTFLQLTIASIKLPPVWIISTMSKGAVLIFK